MDKQFFEEMRKISHQDELRSKLLLYGVKQILEEKQEKKSAARRLFLFKRRTTAK